LLHLVDLSSYFAHDERSQEPKVYNFSFSAMHQDKGWGTDGLHVVPKLLSSEEVCCGSVGSLDVLQTYSVYKNVETRKNILITMKENMYSRALDQSSVSKVSQLPGIAQSV
jgi:hypothetical protein